MANLVYERAKPTIFSREFYDKVVVTAVGQMCRVRGDKDVCHLGLFRLLLLELIDDFTEREKKELQVWLFQ